MKSDKVTEEINELEFDLLKQKLMCSEEGEGWSAEFTETVEREYRRFLELTKAYPDLAIVPSGPIDTFWHYHILDTQKYGPDCEKVFGFFLHHFPYFGMRNAEDDSNLSYSWDNTVDLYRQHFGEPPVGLWDKGTRCPKCGRVAPYAMPRSSAATVRSSAPS